MPKAPLNCGMKSSGSDNTASAGPGKGETVLSPGGLGNIIKPRTSKMATAQFAEWASLFSGKIFVTLTVYADESGTHDPTGNLRGSEAPVFGGFMDTFDRWQIFRTHWESVLDKYKVPYFHYREFAPVLKTRNDPKSPYYGWDDRKRDEFIFELAAVAGHQVPVASMLKLKGMVGRTADDLYWTAIDCCFQNVIFQLNSFWPNQKDKVNFIFDQNENREWIGRWAGVFSEWKQKEPRLGSYSFADKKDPINYPLQAADLLAYRVRKGALMRLDSDKPLFSGTFDQFLLFRMLHDRNSQYSIASSRKAALRAAMQSTEEKFGFKQDLSQ